jgi:hypothetical protein
VAQQFPGIASRAYRAAAIRWTPASPFDAEHPEGEVASTAV